MLARCGEAHGLERDCDDDAAWKYSDAEDGRGEVEGKITTATRMTSGTMRT